MKTFFKIDVIVQQLVFGIMIFYLIFNYQQNTFGGKIFYFYYAVGGFQLVSFLIRFLLNYKKSLIFKIYGFLLLPVWITLFLSGILQGENINLGVLNKIAGIFWFLLYASFFYAPVLSVLYIFDILKTLKNYEKPHI